MDTTLAGAGLASLGTILRAGFLAASFGIGFLAGLAWTFGFCFLSAMVVDPESFQRLERFEALLWLAFIHIFQGGPH
jgi:hypothetical protein